MRSKFKVPKPEDYPEDKGIYEQRKTIYERATDESNSNIENIRKRLELGDEFGFVPTPEEQLRDLKGDSTRAIENMKRNIDRNKL